MTTGTGQKHEWLVTIPDHDGALEKRLNVRKEHLEKMTPEVESGWCVFGGAYLEEHPKEGETPKMRGSVLIAVAETKEEVLSRLKQDVYTTSDVWDWDKVQIQPFKSAIRRAM